MNRKEFIRNSLAFGIGLPFLNTILSGCDDELIAMPEFDINFSGKVLIIGAGAAGLTAGYILQRHGIDFEIIEAAAGYGGRVKRIDDFIDLPLDLGAEWIHQSPSVLADILNDPSLDAKIDFVNYTPKTIQRYSNGKLRDLNWVSDFQSEHKFKSTTWYGFFERFMVPQIESNIRLNQPVRQVDYSGDGVVVTTNDGSSFTGDKVLITVPMTILKNASIEFTPALPSEKTDVFNRIQMDAGLKVFIEFSERFYPDALITDGFIESLTEDTKTYFDAVFGKDTNRHVLGLFAINEQASVFTDLGTDQAIFEAVMRELDTIYEGKASRYYVKHVVQNWSSEPYVQGSYTYSFDGDQEEMVNTMVRPLNNKVYFAGEACSIDNQATVHGACESAYTIMRDILA